MGDLEKRHRAIIKKLEESMRKSQESRKSLVMVAKASRRNAKTNANKKTKTKNGMKKKQGRPPKQLPVYDRHENVTGVLDSIEKSSRQIRAYIRSQAVRQGRRRLVTPV